jgi:peptide/nickel transport system permease protein
MVSSGVNLFDQWWTWLFPGLAIAFLVLAFNFIGDGLRDLLDPRLRNR